MINVEVEVDQGRPVTISPKGAGKSASTWIVLAKEGISSSNRSRDRALAKPNTHRAFHCAGWHRLQTSERQSEPIRAQKGERTYDIRDQWMTLRGNPKVGLWTDDYYSILSVLTGEWKFWAKD